MNSMCHKYIKAAIATIDLDTVDKDSGVLAKVPVLASSVVVPELLIPDLDIQVRRLP